MKCFMIALLVLAATLSSSAQQKYRFYSNARYAYEIVYPADLMTGQGEPDAGDGQVFQTKDKMAKLYVWGQYNALRSTLAEEFGIDQRKRKKIVYKALLSDGYVLSHIEKGKIYYAKTILRGKDGDEAATYATFILEYPESQKAKFDPIVNRIAKSFKFH